MRQAISTEGAPRAIGPYSQAIKAGGFIFASGQVGLDPATGKLVSGGIAAETERALRNLKAVLEASDSSLERAVKATVYLVDLNEFSQMNEVYRRFFGEAPPARATVEVRRLPLDARVEIELVALA